MPRLPPAGHAAGRNIGIGPAPGDDLLSGPGLNAFPGDKAPPLIIAKACSAESFARLMKTGITAIGAESAAGLMTEMGRLRFSVMTDDEIRALELFLDSR